MSESSREQQLEAILHSYLQAVDARQNPDREELLRLYPDFADELREFFTDQAKMDRMALALKQVDAATLPPTPGLLGSEVSSAVAADAPEVGTTIRYFGDYELLEEIAQGGMGVVYKAKQISLNRLVAVKMILGGSFAGDLTVQRFRREAEAAANLDHPNIVPIHEVGEHQGQHFFSMKLIEGPSLAQRLKGRSPAFGIARAEQQEAARLLATVARAVHHAHQRGILHRDLKPGNILLDAAGAPHVTDFGLARRIDGDSRLTQSNAIVGTPSYMAPEQAVGKKDLTIRADVYSLGAILYEQLTGRPPFQAETRLDTILQVVGHEPVAPRTLNPQLDADLEAICLKCLAKEPHERYESAAALGEDLERWLCGAPVRARRNTIRSRVWRWLGRPERMRDAGIAAILAAAFLASLVWSAPASSQLYIIAAAMTGVLALLDLWIGIRSIYRKTWAVRSGFLLSMVITANLLASIVIVIPVMPWSLNCSISMSDFIGAAMAWALAFLFLWIGIRTIYRKAWAVWSGFLLSMVIMANLMASIVIPVIPPWIGHVPDFLRFVAEGAIFPTGLVIGCVSFTYLLAIRACERIRRDQVVDPKRGQPRWPRVRWTLVVIGVIGVPVIGVTICFGALRWFESVYQSHAIEAEFKRSDEQKAVQRNIDLGDHRYRAKWNLKMGREACRYGRFDVGMLQLARGLRKAVAGEAADIESELRLELGRYAPRLPRIVTMNWNGQGVQNRYYVDRTYGISLSRDGKRLIAAGASSVCDVDASLRLKPAFTEKDPFRSGVAISPDGRQFANGNLLCDASTGKLLRKLEGMGPHKFAPDGKRLLSAGNDGWLLLLDPATGRAVGTPIGKGAYSADSPGCRPVVFSPDSSMIAFVRQVDKKRADVQLWDAIKGEALGAALSVEKIEALAISPDGKLLATAGPEGVSHGSTVRLWDVKTGKPSGGPWLDNPFVKSMTFSPDGKVLLTGGLGPQLWDLDTGKPRRPRQGAFGNVPVLLFFAADGKTFWTVTSVGLEQWDSASGRLLGGVDHQLSKAQDDSSKWACGVSADGRRIAVAGLRTSEWARFEQGDWKRGSRIDQMILVWELPAGPDAKEVAPPWPGTTVLPGIPPEETGFLGLDSKPLTGTPAQIDLWLQAQTGRETVEYDPNARVDNMRIEEWWECREKLIADGGLPIPSK